MRLLQDGQPGNVVWKSQETSVSGNHYTEDELRDKGVLVFEDTLGKAARLLAYNLAFTKKPY